MFTKRSMLLLAICVVAVMSPLTSFAGDLTTGDEFTYVTAIPLDGRAYPAYDYSRANRLPAEMTGYWEKSFLIDGVPRTAKVYISAETPIRSYYTVIAIPDGVDTEVFLWKAGWIDMADRRGEALFVLEPGPGGWGSATDEQVYISAAINFYANVNVSPANRYFSIFGEHYFVGYGAGAPPLEAWAVANPLRVISQVYIDSPGLPTEYLNQYASLEYGGANGSYVTIPFPPGFRKIRYDETVLPTWYINPRPSAAASIAYWKASNDCVTTPVKDTNFGLVYHQADRSGRWMTSYSGPISKVAVLKRPVSYWNKNTQGDIQSFMYFYSRYENVVAYGNQLVERADYAKLGIEIHNIMVNGYIREYMVYVPELAAQIWGDKAPVLYVFPGDSQTDRVFLDATQWWKVAQKEGFVLVIICEQYSSSSVVVSHRDNNIFYPLLRDVINANYRVDPTRAYATGQSAGSMASQGFAITNPEYFAAVASTSGSSSPGNTATYKPIPVYMIVGAGDMSNFAGTLWDTRTNGLDSWAAYHLGVNGLAKGDGSNGVVSGWYDRFTDWTWTKAFNGIDVPVFKVGHNAYRSHNCIYEEMPKLWDYAKHFSSEVDGAGNVIRYYSPSGFKASGDRVQITP